MLTGEATTTGRIKTYEMVDRCTTARERFGRRIPGGRCLNVRLTDRDLPVGQPVAGRTLLRRERRRCSPAPRRGPRGTPPRAPREPAAPVPTSRSQTGTSRPWARNIPTSRESGTSWSRPAACSRASASSAVRLGLGEHPAQVLLGASRRSSTPRRPSSAGSSARPRRRPARGRPARSAVWSSTSATHQPKPSCTVTSRSSPVTRSCRRGPGPGGSVSPTMPGSASSALSSTAPEVARRVAEVVLHLEPEPDGSRVADHRGRRRRAAGCRAGPRGRRASGSLSVSGAVADGTSSRRATTSRSPGRPSNGRATYTSAPPSAAPWQCL